MTGAEIREARRRLGMTQRELAAALGLGDKGGNVTVSRWEHDAMEPPPYLRLALSDLLRKPPESPQDRRGGR